MEKGVWGKGQRLNWGRKQSALAVGHDSTCLTRGKSGEKEGERLDCEGEEVDSQLAPAIMISLSSVV